MNGESDFTEKTLKRIIEADDIVQKKRGKRRSRVEEGSFLEEKKSGLLRKTNKLLTTGTRFIRGITCRLKLWFYMLSRFFSLFNRMGFLVCLAVIACGET